jgi:hypothetical protein
MIVRFLYYSYRETVISVTEIVHIDLVKALEEEEKMTPEQLAIKNVGKLDPKRHLEEKVSHWLMAF